MNFFKAKSRVVKGLLIAVAAVLVLFAACMVYLLDYYHADMEAISAFTADSIVSMHYDEDGNILWEPEQASAGLVFYQGAKVEHRAYIPLMDELASRGILCVLVKMPFQMAAFDMDAAEEIPEEFPQIKEWYLGGHSFGGSMAASCLADDEKSFDGLVLLGSYSVTDLSRTSLDVLSVYGSNDMVLNREKYEENKGKLPADFQEVIIEGGNHACFGMYGIQKGDGTAAITNEQQIVKTADAIEAMILQ